MYDYQTDPQYRSLMANALQTPGPSYTPAQAFINALTQGLKGYQAGKFREGGEARKGAELKALGDVLAQQPVDSVAVTPRVTDPGQVEQRDLAGAYSQPTEKDLLSKILASPNADVVNDFSGPAFQSQMQAQALANQPIRPIERAQLAGQRRTSEAQLANLLADNARQDRLADPKYKAEVARAEADATVADRIKVAQAGRPVYPGQSGPFGGTGIDAQVMNILINGDPSSPVFAAAYAKAAEPKMQFDAQTGQIIPIIPDMSPYRKPAQMQQPQGAPQAQAGASGPTVGKPIQAAAIKPTDTQAASALYADRATEAEAILSGDPTKGVAGVANEGASIMGRGREAIPMGLGNYGQSKEYQSFEQARRNFINATLRRESGAVINPDEFRQADLQYFPVPGDGPEVIAQKAANRKTAIEGLHRMSGSYGQQGQGVLGPGSVPPPAAGGGKTVRFEDLP